VIIPTDSAPSTHIMVDYKPMGNRNIIYTCIAMTLTPFMNY